jgi:hypothetical protein
LAERQSQGFTEKDSSVPLRLREHRLQNYHPDVSPFREIWLATYWQQAILCLQVSLNLLAGHFDQGKMDLR